MKFKIPQFKKPKFSYLTNAAVFLILILPFIAFADTNPYSDALKGITTLLFIAFFTLFAAITLLAIAVMLFIRYIALTILLILSPLVWLCWILPSTKEYWSKWWHNFLKWAMFLPAVLFFLYLTVATIGKFPDMLVKYAGPQRNLPNQGFAIDVAYIADLVAILGLLIGGLYTANALGIYGAKTFYGMAQGSAKIFGGWVGRQGVRAGTWALRGKQGKKLVEGMQKYGAGRGTLGRILTGAPLVNRLGHAMTRVGVIQGENLVKEAEERQKKFSDKQLALRVASLSRDEQVAALARLAKNRNLDMVSNAAKYIADSKTKKIFAAYGKDKEYGDLEKTAGFNTAMLTGRDENGDPISREEATKRFRQSYSIKDYDKLQGNILSAYHAEKNNLGLTQADHEELRRLTRETIFGIHPGAITKVRPKLKGQDLLDFQDELDKYIDTLEGSIRLPQDMRGINIPIKTKLTWVDNPANQVNPYFRNLARSLYGARKNFAGSLFGAFYISEREEGEPT